MLTIGLLREGKSPADNRVALTPAQCKWMNKNVPNVEVIVELSPNRCYSNEEYAKAGIKLVDNLAECDIIMGIKEVPYEKLIADKTYLFFSHTIKKQEYNKKLLQTILERNITLIDYECLKHEDGQRILGFGFFAGIVGAHNGIMCYGNRTNEFSLARVYQQKDFRSLINSYFGLKLPNIKIAVTGSGRVAHGVLEVMNLMGIHEVEPDDYLERQYSYPVYTQLKGAALYEHKETGKYNRVHFHENQTDYKCKFQPYSFETDILMNGVYWDEDVPRLFEKGLIQNNQFRIKTISDITDDENGSVPINLGDQTIENPVYGVSKKTFSKTAPYLNDVVDVIAVGNLPNELPRDASRYFGEQLIKYILDDVIKGGSAIIEDATIAKGGKLTASYNYLQEWVSTS
jgi:saccharopine dehydrogenase (NAD+, L-lysine forming)